MTIDRSLRALVAGCAIAVLAGCQTAPPPVVVPASFTPLGTSAPYLLGDVIGGQRVRAAKMRAAKIRPLSPYEVGPYMADLDSELRRQTAGIGLDVLQVGGSIVIRIPAIFTFDEGSASVKATTDATLLEIARTVKTRNRTFVDVLAHTDTTGTPQGNKALSDRRAAAVATYLAAHGVSKARIASRGLGESAPLYNPDTTEEQKAANRRIEIRLVPYDDQDAYGERAAGFEDYRLLQSRLALSNGATDQASKFSNAALAAARAQHSEDPIGDRYRLAMAYRLVGDVNQQRNDPQGAAASWSAGLNGLPPNVAERPWETNERAELLLRLGRAKEAAPLSARLDSIRFHRMPQRH